MTDLTPTPDQPAPAPAPNSPCRPAVLPGSRWLQGSHSGHGTQTNSVIRVGEHPVTFVMEGGGKGGGSHKSGRKYTVPLDAFLMNHTLLSQPPGYKPGDELLPDRPKTDTLQTYFARRAAARRFTGQLDGSDVRYAVTGDLVPPVRPEPSDDGYAFLLAVVRPPDLPAPPESDPEESAVSTPSTPHAARDEPVANPVISPQQVSQLLDRMERPAPQDEPVTTAAIAAAVVAAAEATAAGHRPAPQAAATPVLPSAPAPEAEPDPVEQFMESGRVLVDGLNARIATAQQALDEAQQRVEAAQGVVERLTRQRDRIEGAVMAAIASTGEPTEAPPPAPPARVAAPAAVEAASAVRTVVAAGGVPRNYGETGFVGTPGKPTQREWALDRMASAGRFAVAEHRDAFAREYGLSPDAATKNLSSLMGYQLKSPSPRWPKIVRLESGVYAVALQDRDARAR